MINKEVRISIVLKKDSAQQCIEFSVIKLTIEMKFYWLAFTSL
jgi:hypothetical protein